MLYIFVLLFLRINNYILCTISQFLLKRIHISHILHVNASCILKYTTIGEKHQRDQHPVQRADGMDQVSSGADDRRRGVRVRGHVASRPVDGPDGVAIGRTWLDGTAGRWRCVWLGKRRPAVMVSSGPWWPALRSGTDYNICPSTGLGPVEYLVVIWVT